MGGVLWLLALMWAGSGVQVCAQSFFFEDDVDYQLNRTYDNMVNTLNRRASYNMDVAILLGLKVWCIRSGWEKTDLSFFWIQDSMENLEKAVRGECVPRRPWMTYGHSAECLTGEEAIKREIKEVTFSAYNYVAITTEAMTETRLQYYVHKSKEDFVLFLSDRIHAMLEEVLSACEKPSAVVVTNLYRFLNLLTQRHLKGHGSPESVVWAADGIARGLNSLLQVAPYTFFSVSRILAVTREKTSLFTDMYIRNLNRIVSTAIERGDMKVPHRAVSRYWDSRAMEYGVSWLFRINSLEGKGAYKLDDLLAEILEKHVAGDITAAMKLAQRGLDDAKKCHHKLGPGAGKVPLTKVPFVGVIPNVALDDVNLLGVPTIFKELEEMTVEETLRNFLGESYVEQVVNLKHMFKYDL